eukprot:c16707_g1_i2.p1 GENE.c16707_g1_i2~~c16707_g1_i2.p1  ORF type:complete len:272 (-),score=45.94 c16707_g1_i2:563-1378(-)
MMVTCEINPANSFSPRKFRCFGPRRAWGIESSMLVWWLLACLAITSAFPISVADCVKYGSCADSDIPVLGGNDVVEYFSPNASQGVLGTDDWAFEYKGYSFWFRNEENYNKFQAAPQKYIPQCGGFCAYAVSCHGGAGVCIPNGAVAINSTNGWLIHEGRLFMLGQGAKPFIDQNRTLLDFAAKNWNTWYPEHDKFNTDAFWPYRTSSGDSTCRSCGFEGSSANTNIMARSRRLFLSRSGAVSVVTQNAQHPFSSNTTRPPSHRSLIPGVR